MPWETSESRKPGRFWLEAGKGAVANRWEPPTLAGQEEQGVEARSSFTQDRRSFWKRIRIPIL
jgi:hypothetical protein